MSEFTSEFAEAPIEPTILCGVLPLLLLHLTCIKNDYPIPMCCGWNMRYPDSIRLGLKSSRDENVVPITTIMCREDDNSRAYFFHGGTVILSLTSYKTLKKEEVNYNTGCLIEPIFKLHDILPVDTIIYQAIPLTIEILQEAIQWVRGQGGGGDSVVVPSVEEGIQIYLRELEDAIPKGQCVEELNSFIATHTWDEDKPDVGDNNSYSLRRFIHDNLARQTKVIAHVLDGLHRLTALDFIMVGFGLEGNEVTDYANNYFHLKQEVVARVYSPKDFTFLLELQMRHISAKVQATHALNIPHGIREFLSHSFLDLEVRCKVGKLRHLHGDSDTALYRYISTKNLSLDNVHELLREDQVSEEIIQTVKTQKDGTFVFIQDWIKKIAEMITLVLQQSPCKMVVRHYVNIDELLDVSKQHMAIFRRNGSRKEGYGYYFSEKKLQLNYFMGHTNYYSENRYNPGNRNTLNANEVELGQLMLWYMLHPTTSQQLLNLVMCHDYTRREQQSVANQKDISRWISAFIHSVTSSVFYSQSIWTRGLKPAQRKVKDTTLSMFLLVETICRTADIYSRVGPIPVLRKTEESLIDTICYNLKKDRNTVDINDLPTLLSCFFAINNELFDDSFKGTDYNPTEGQIEIMSGQLTALDPPPQEKTFCGSGLRSIRYDEDDITITTTLQQLDYIPTTDIMQFVQCWENNTAKYTGITEGVIQRLWTRLRNREMFPGLKTPERADASLQQKDQQSESDTLLQQQESESEKYTVSQSIVKLHNKLLDKLKGMEDELTVIRDQGGEDKIAEEANTLITLKGADHITGTFIGDSE